MGQSGKLKAEVHVGLTQASEYNIGSRLSGNDILIKSKNHVHAMRTRMETTLKLRRGKNHILIEAISEDLVHRQTANPNATNSEFDGYR